MKEYKETHQQGFITFEKEMKVGYMDADVGIQIAEDGRIWLCINGEAAIRFRPKNTKKLLTSVDNM
jgi:hypothetical protein